MFPEYRNGYDVKVPWIRGEELPFDRGSIARAPESVRVYAIGDRAGRVLFIGRGPARKSLFTYFERHTNAPLSDNQPYTFVLELSTNAEAREAALLKTFKTACGPPSPDPPPQPELSLKGLP